MRPFNTKDFFVTSTDLKILNFKIQNFVWVYFPSPSKTQTLLHVSHSLTFDKLYTDISFDSQSNRQLSIALFWDVTPCNLV